MRALAREVHQRDPVAARADIALDLHEEDARLASGTVGSSKAREASSARERRVGRQHDPPARAGGRSAAGRRRRRTSPRCGRSRAGARSSRRRCRRCRGRRTDGAEHAQTCRRALRRDVDVAVVAAAARCRRRTRLARDPVAQLVVDRVVSACHGATVAVSPARHSAAISRSVAAASRSVTRTWRSSPHCSPAATLIRRRPRCSDRFAPDGASEDSHANGAAVGGKESGVPCSAAASRSRSRAAAARRRAITASPSSSAHAAAACAGALTENDGVRRSASPPARARSRCGSPAIACALEKVRKTSRFGQLGHQARGVLAGLGKSASASSSSTHTRSPTRSQQRAHVLARDRRAGRVVGARERDRARVRRRRASASGPIAALARARRRVARRRGGELGQRTPAGPRHEQLAAVGSSAAQASCSSSPAPWPTATCSGETPCRAASGSRTARAPGSGYAFMRAPQRERRGVDRLRVRRLVPGRAREVELAARRRPRAARSLVAPLAQLARDLLGRQLLELPVVVRSAASPRRERRRRALEDAGTRSRTRSPRRSR